jgi:hypothetical protein
MNTASKHGNSTYMSREDREKRLRSLADKQRKSARLLIEDLRKVAMWRLSHSFPKRRAEPLLIMRETEKICALFAEADVKTENLLTRLEVHEL